MKRKSIIATCVLIISACNLTGQTFYGEIRQRGEYRYGYKVPADSSSDYAVFVSQRTRLGVSFDLKNVQTKITIQDVRVWGNQKLKSSDATTGIYEAWVLLPLTDSLSLKLGRQELIYDNERILSNNNWNQAGQVHDAAVVKYRHNGLKVDWGLSYNSQEESLFGNDYSESFKGGKLEGNYKSMSFIHLEKMLTKKLKLSITSVGDAFQKENTSNTNYVRGTFGGSAIWETPFSTFLSLHGYYQTGKTPDALKINAWYLNPEANVKLNKLSLNPGAEIFSGNNKNTGAEGKHYAFSSLYGTGHNYNGHMDYFTDIPKHTKNAGLIDIYLKNSFKLTDKASLKLDYHYFKLQNEYVYHEELKTTVYSYSYLGSEIDFNCNIEFSKEVGLLFGYSVFIPEEPLNYILGGDSGKLSQWGFVMLTVKPNFKLSK